MCSFPILGVLGVFFHFLPNFNRIFCKQTEYLDQTSHYANSADPDLTLHNAGSDLGLHSLPMSHIKGTRLIWVYSSIYLVCAHLCFAEKEVNETGKGVNVMGKDSDVAVTETEQRLESRENRLGS